MKKSVREMDVRARKVLVRTDYNVPLDPESGCISDDTRVAVSIPTIRYLLDHGAAVIVCTHLGRPKGVTHKESRLELVALALSTYLGQCVQRVDGWDQSFVQQSAANLKPGEVLLLENLRFHSGEEDNDQVFARQLASLADVYVNDAFSVSHRAHASTTGVARFLPAVAGFLMEKELAMLTSTLEDPSRPLGAVIGGAKVSDKMAVLENLWNRVDYMFIGGGMAAAFVCALRKTTGGLAVDQDQVNFASHLLSRPANGNPILFSPTDVVVAKRFEAFAETRTVCIDSIPEGWLVMDIGPVTAQTYARELAKCRTVVWNGPLGVFEWEPFSYGTRAVAEAMAQLQGKAITIVGGGSTTEAVVKLQLHEAMTHVSMGGGASLEFLEGKLLPGVAVLLESGEQKR